MSSQPAPILPPPVTPVRVPKAVTVYTPSTQDPDLRSQINTLLLREGHVEKISQALQHALHAHPSNWPSRVSNHAFALLRAGECTTFPTLMERVLADVRRDTEAEVEAARKGGADAGAGTGAKVNGVAGAGAGAGAGAVAVAGALEKAAKEKGKGKGKGKAGGVGEAMAMANGGAGLAGVNGVVRDDAAGTTATAKTGLAVPQTVIEEAIRITRECLEQVCEVDE